MPGLLTDQEYAAQFQPGRGVTARYGPKPPTPDEVAPRGTPEWREAFRKQDEWRRFQTHAGATAFDMGLRDAKDLGKHYFTRMREGTVDPRARGNWIKSNEGWGRGTFKPNDDRFYGTWGKTGPGNLEKQQMDPRVPEGTPDLWPGSSGMEGSLPQYAAPQYNPVDSWGGWSGVYGANTPQMAGANPAGMSNPVMSSPASANTGYSGGGTPGAGLNMGLGGQRTNMPLRRRNPTQGGSFGGPTQIGGVRQGVQPIQPQSMLIRR